MTLHLLIDELTEEYKLTPEQQFRLTAKIKRLIHSEMTLHLLIDELTEEYKLTPEQQFRLTAKIKRLIHSEKASVFHRYWMYSHGAPHLDENGNTAEEPPTPPDPWLHDLLRMKFEQHKEMAEKYTDEELVTWNVGSYKYVHPKLPCSECSVDLGNIGYMSQYKDGVSVYHCKTCAEKKGIWDDEE